MREADNGVVVITGASRGIGAATARLAAQSGHAVCINFRANAEAAQAIADDIGRAGGHAIAVRADVTDPLAVEAMFTTVDRELGRLTGLVNNAAISGGRHALVDLAPPVVRAVFETNLVGPFLCAKAASQRMAISRGGVGGAIVNLSTAATVTGGFRLSPYVASKAGIEGMTRALAGELAAEGIRVNAVSPGIIATAQQPLDDEEWRQRAASAVPLGRLGTPAEVAAAIVWLLGPQSSSVTGSVLPVSGGR